MVLKIGYVSFFNIFLLFKYSFLPFPPTSPHYPSHPHLPPLFPPPLLLSMCPLQFFLKTLHPLPLWSPPLSPLVTVSLFSISVPLVKFCLLVRFVDQVPVKGEIIWYLSFTTWLISLSIMLSSSTHVLQRVGAPSFFLLHKNSIV